MSTTTTAPESGSRSRTRRAILDAAAKVLAQDASASLGQVAEAAQVGRSTLHRYFPEREDLVRALARHLLAESDRCFERARPDVGDPTEALRRVVDAFFELGPALMYLYNEPLLAGDTEFWAAMDDGPDPLDRILDRAADRLRPELPRAWMRTAFWSLMYAGWLTVRDQGLPQHEVAESIMVMFERGAFRD